MKICRQLFILFLTLLLFLPALQVNAISTGSDSVTTVIYPLTLTDGAGRNVTFDVEPAKIISIAASATEVLYAVGAGDKIIAVDPTSNYPVDTADLPKVANFPSLDVEGIVSLDPDVVFGAGITRQADIDTLESNGIIVFILAPFSLEDVLDDIDSVGSITNHLDDAITLRNSLQVRIDAVNESATTFAVKPKVFIESGEWNGYSTYGADTYGHDLIELAGGINIAENATGSYPSVNDEFIIIQNPDVIFYANGTWTTTNATTISQRPGWSVITAVNESRIYAINEDWVSRGGPRIIDALEEIHARLLDVTPTKTTGVAFIPGFEGAWILTLAPVAVVVILKRRSKN